MTTSLKALEEFKARKQTIASDMTECADLLLQANINDVNLSRQIEILNDFQFKIAVIGEFSSGKSTFLNSLLGDKLLPAKMAPCTSASVEITYGEEKKFFVKEGEGTFKEHPWEDIKEYMVIPRDKAQDEEKYKQHIRERELSLLIQAPLSLCKNDVRLIDTAGLNEEQSRTKATHETLPNVDAAIWLTRSHQLWAKSERETLEEIAKWKEHERRWMDNTFVAATFADVAFEDEDEEEDLRERMNHYCDKVLPPRGFARDRRYFIDARSALMKQLNKSTNSDGYDYNQLIVDLTRFITTERGETTLSNSKALATQSIQQAIGSIESELANIETNAGTLRQNMAVAEENLANQRQNLRVMSNGLRQLGEQMTRRIKDKFATDSDLWLWKQYPAFLNGEDYPNKIIRPKLPTEWYIKQSRLWFERQQSDWVEAVPKVEFENLLSDFEKQYKDNLEEFRGQVLESASSMHCEGFSLETESGDALSWLLRTGAGWLAGGPLGAVVGGALGWNAVAANLAINFAAVFGIAALGFATPVIGQIALAAVIAGLQLGFGQEKIKNKIRKNVIGKFQQKLAPLLKNAGSKIETQSKAGVDNLVTEFENAANGILSIVKESVEHARKNAQAGEAERAARVLALNQLKAQLEQRIETIRSR